MNKPRFVLGVVFCVLIARGMADYASALQSGHFAKAFEFPQECAEQGEALFHGLNAPVSNYMPVHSLWQALLRHHCSASTREICLAASWPLWFLLLFALACLAGSPESGLIATTILGAMYQGLDTAGGTQQLFYSPMIIAVACALVWRIKSPAPWASLWVGLAVGSSLLYRSLLAFFPPMLIALQMFQARTWRICKWDLIGLGLIPYLFLVPWLRMNWGVYHHVVPFESQLTETLLMGAARGAPVGSLDLNRVRSPVIKNNLLLSATREILNHPLRYLQGYMDRVLFAVKPYPFLILTALLGAWVHRRRPEHTMVALLALYLFAVNCSVYLYDHSYFLPVWPLLAFLAASLIDGPWRRTSIADGSLRRIGAILSSLFLIPMICFSSYAMGKVLAFPAQSLDIRPTPSQSVDSEIASYPADSWLRFYRGRVRLANGDPAGAAEDFSQALRLEPKNEKHELWLARAYLRQGRPELMIQIQPSRTNNKHGALDWLKAEAYRAAGDLAREKYHRKRARELWGSVTKADIQRATDPREKARLQRLYSEESRRFEPFFKDSVTEF